VVWHSVATVEIRVNCAQIVGFQFVEGQLKCAYLRAWFYCVVIGCLDQCSSVLWVPGMYQTEISTHAHTILRFPTTVFWHTCIAPAGVWDRRRIGIFLQYQSARYQMAPICSKWRGPEANGTDNPNSLQ